MSVAVVTYEGRVERVSGVVADIVGAIVQCAKELEGALSGAVEIRFSPSDLEVHHSQKLRRVRRPT